MHDYGRKMAQEMDGFIKETLEQHYGDVKARLEELIYASEQKEEGTEEDEYDYPAMPRLVEVDDSVD